MSTPRDVRPGSQRTLRIVAVALSVAVAVCAVAVALAFHGAARTISDTRGDSSLSMSAPSSTHSAEAKSPTPSTTSPTVDLGSRSPRTSTEVQNPGATGEHTLSSTVSGLLTGPMPAQASAVNSLVAGFPNAIPLIGHSKIISSSVSFSGMTLQASLTATTTATAASLISSFGSQFARIGVWPTPSAAVGGSTAVVFTQGIDSVTVTATPLRTGGCSYSVLGILHAAS